MPRIAHATFTNAFDRVFEKLAEHGGDRISRAEAKQVADDFKKAGDGDAAFAADALYRYVDQLDAAPGSQTTGADFAQARTLLSDQLKALDQAPRNGLSRAELNQLPETLKPMMSALLQVARLAAVAKTPGRKSIRLFEAGLEHSLGLLKEAAGPDKRLSVADASTLVSDLLAQGRGTEALAVGNLFTIASARDGAGHVVGHDDLDDAGRWALESIDKRDKGAPGFSNDELDAMPPTWGALLRVGQMAEGGVLRSPLDIDITKPTDGGTVDPDPAPAPAKPWADLSPREAYDALAGISDNDVGGVSYPATIHGVQSSARAKVQSHLDKVQTALTKDYPADDVSLTLSDLRRGEDGREVTRGYSALFELREPGGATKALELIFDTTGRVLGRNFERYGVSDPSISADLTPRNSTWDAGVWYFDPPWQPETTLTDAAARKNFAQAPTDENAQLVQLARSVLLENLFDYRRNNDGEVDSRQGSWEIGTRDTDDGPRTFVHWADIDDSSFTLSFEKTATGWELDLLSFDN
jgi:hypothetical protein